MNIGRRNWAAGVMALLALAASRTPCALCISAFLENPA
jgi:hypothetical protein